MATRITATEAARNFSDILNRVRYRGESFIIERSGEVVANLSPETKKVKESNLGKALASKYTSIRSNDSTFADDLAKIIDEQSKGLPGDPWES